MGDREVYVMRPAHAFVPMVVDARPARLPGLFEPQVAHVPNRTLASPDPRPGFAARTDVRARTANAAATTAAGGCVRPAQGRTAGQAGAPDAGSGRHAHHRDQEDHGDQAR